VGGVEAGLEIEEEGVVQVEEVVENEEEERLRWLLKDLKIPSDLDALDRTEDDSSLEFEHLIDIPNLKAIFVRFEVMFTLRDALHPKSVYIASRKLQAPN